MIIGSILRHVLGSTPQVLRSKLLCRLVLLFALLLTVSTSFAAQRTILVVGDSISAAYGMDLEQGWVALTQRKLNAEAPDWTVVNASISGDTTGGGLQRLPGLLSTHNPEVVIIELGGNDGLRGYPIPQMRQNLTTMTEQAQKAGARVLLLAMEIPPNFGRRYTELFRNSFQQVADKADAIAAPFILDGIATHPEKMQADGIHPTAEAQPQIVENVWGFLQPLLRP